MDQCKCLMRGCKHPQYALLQRRDVWRQCSLSCNASQEQTCGPALQIWRKPRLWAQNASQHLIFRQQNRLLPHESSAACNDQPASQMAETGEAAEREERGETDEHINEEAEFSKLESLISWLVANGESSAHQNLHQSDMANRNLYDLTTE